ncbi:MAG: molybdenum cofactor cytidylyltransferase [Desulfuromonadales bacterium]|nr:molybdenum cofactor cytidylyltransferase [Desulfuromonadales bacterium]
MSCIPRVAGIILAAGSSSRMGRPKQLLPFRGHTLLECIVDTALNSSLSKVVVVLGHRADELRPLLAGRDVTVVLNDDYQRGQSSSIQAGLRTVREDVDAALFLLGDQPLVTPETIDSILSAYAVSQGLIVMPVFDGRRGNPVLFDRQTFDDIDSLTGDTGARLLFQDYANHIVEVPLHDPSVHFDVDTEQDFKVLKKME